jgi:hypothetical protein
MVQVYDGSAMSTKRAVSNIEHELECKLAAFVRSYIDASLSGESSYANEALTRVCSGFEYLVGHLLNERDEWRGRVDGIIPATDMVPDAIRVDSSLGFTLNGRAIWGESSRGPFWIEPFRGSVRLTEGTDALIDYEIRFADASRGLATFPYGKHLRRAEWYLPQEWLFMFSKGSMRKSDTSEKPS